MSQRCLHPNYFIISISLSASTSTFGKPREQKENAQTLSELTMFFTNFQRNSMKRF